MRKLIVNGLTYEWSVGRGSVVVRHKNSFRYVKSIAKVLGIDEYEWERLCYKSPRSSARSITPSMIREIIKREDKI